MALALSVAMVCSSMAISSIPTNAASKTKKLTMYKGAKKNLVLKKAKKVKWKTSNKKIVSIKKLSTNKCKVTAKNKGKATITATYKKKKYRWTITVKVKKESKPDNIIVVKPSAAPVTTPTPTPTPDVSPTTNPSTSPAITVSPVETPKPTTIVVPTIAPTVKPTAQPTATPTVTVSPSPTVAPTVSPTVSPTTQGAIEAEFMTNISKTFDSSKSSMTALTDKQIADTNIIIGNLKDSASKYIDKAYSVYDTKNANNGFALYSVMKSAISKKDLVDITIATVDSYQKLGYNIDYNINDNDKNYYSIISGYKDDMYFYTIITPDRQFILSSTKTIYDGCVKIVNSYMKKLFIK